MMRKRLLRFQKRTRILNKFFKAMMVKPYHLIVPVAFSFLAAAMGGIGLGLLLPLVRGVVENNYSFVYEIPVLSNLVNFIQRPQWDFFTTNRAMFLFLTILIFFATMFKFICQYLSRVLSAYWSRKFSQRIRVFVFKRVLGFGKLYFDRKGQGYVFSVVNYSEKVLSLLEFVRESIANLLDIGVHFVIMIIISWHLTFFTLLLIPLLHFSLKKILQKITLLSEKNTQQEILLSRQILNVLSGIPLIKAYAKEDDMVNKYDHSTERLRKLLFRRDKLRLLLEPVHGMIVLAALLILVAVVALILARDRASDLAAFAVFFYVARDMFPKFMIFNKVREQVAVLKPPLKEVHKIFYRQGKGIVHEGNIEWSGLSRQIEIDKLCFAYSAKKPILKNVTTTFEKGKMSAIVGPTGAGKTTLVNLLMRFYDCPPNTIKLDGVDIREFKSTSLRKHISIVTQDDFLFNDTLGNNIIFACDKPPSEEKLWDILKKARLDSFVDGLSDGLNTQVGDRGIRLSGGEKQRVSIARALLRETEILILDEATSSLDTRTERLIQQSIEEAVKGRTTIVIAHRLSTIKNADKVIVIEKGRIVEEGALRELIEKKGKFYQYWQEQKFY